MDYNYYFDLLYNDPTDDHDQRMMLNGCGVEKRKVNTENVKKEIDEVKRKKRFMKLRGERME